MADTFNPADYFGLFGIAQAESALNRKLSSKNFLMVTNGYYVPPIDPLEIALLFESANPYLSLAVEFETDKMMEYFLPSSLFSNTDFRGICEDYFQCGYAYYLKNRNILGQVSSTTANKYPLTRLPYVYMRVMTDGNYCQLDPMGYIIAIYPKNDVGMIKKVSPIQSVYGTPPYMALFQMAMLGEESVITPRREFTSGITRKIITFLGLSNEQLKAVIANFKESKGHQEMTAFLGLPDKDGKRIDDLMKISPDDSSFKIDFDKFFRLSAESIIECRQIPWFMIGAIPDKGSTGLDVDKVERIYARRILILQQIFEAINEDVPNAVQFYKKPLLDLINPPVQAQMVG